MRRHHRFVANKKETSLILPGQIAITCQVQNFSLSGASILTTARPPVGSQVTLGQMKATVMRHHEEGIGVEFVSAPTAARLLSEFGALGP